MKKTEKLDRVDRQRIRRLIRACRAELELPADPQGLQLQRELRAALVEFEQLFHECLTEAQKCDL